MNLIHKQSLDWGTIFEIPQLRDLSHHIPVSLLLTHQLLAVVKGRPRVLSMGCMSEISKVGSRDTTWRTAVDQTSGDSQLRCK